MMSEEETTNNILILNNLKTDNKEFEEENISSSFLTSYFPDNNGNKSYKISNKYYEAQLNFKEVTTYNNNDINNYQGLIILINTSDSINKEWLLSICKHVKICCIIEFITKKKKK